MTMGRRSRTAPRWIAGGWLAGCAAACALAQPAPDITAADIVAKNAAARGGVPAWQRLKTMVWTGYVETGRRPGEKLPFMLEQKRPLKTRFELVDAGQRSIRMYDGRSGWKLRPNPANGRPELTPYSEDEIAFARGAQVIDGPLMDYVAKGGIVTLSGHGEAEGRHAYIVDVKLPSGGNHRIWVDAETFLEVRQDREVRAGLGKMGSVRVVFRDYRDVEGVMLPTRIETGDGPVPDQLVIERVALNPELDDGAFARPESPISRRGSVVVDTRGGMASPVPTPARRP
jgi:hypothetical protein